MADNGHTLRGIDYKSAFAFTHLFKGFRLAIDPSKLGLALAMILLIYCGGRLMDAVWPRQHAAVQEGQGRTALSEVDLYESNSSNFPARRRARLAEMDEELKAEMTAVGKDPTKETPRPATVIGVYEDRREEQVKAARDRYDALTGDARTDAAERARDEEIRAAYATYSSNVDRVGRMQTRGPFISFLEYEIDQVDDIARAAVSLNFFQNNGVLENLSHLLITGPTWAIRHHPLFFSLFFAYLLLLWSIFGGAIARVAAVQVARDEKISVRQALRFSTGKVLSFVFAPLIPIIIVLVLAVILGVAALPMGIPYVGGIWSIIVGLLFFLALLAGLVMTLTTLGLIGGGHLMYPTIAVEGSDSFDAVSRSFSYLYARPWQLIFYSLVALVYGAITYLFVRFFLYLLLWLTHVGVSLFLNWSHADDGSHLVSSMWPQPTNFMQLSYSPNNSALNPMHDIGSWLIAFWNYLTISLLGAYLISLFFSSSTIIYYLMRREVDATGLDDVYVEPSDDEFADPAPDSVPPEAAALTGGSAGGFAAGGVAAAAAPEAPPFAPASTPMNAPESILPSEGDPNVIGQPIDLPAPPADENRPQ